MLSALFLLANAAITNFDKIVLSNATLIYQSYYMFDKEFTTKKGNEMGRCCDV